jgi:hypothetical protein
MAEIINLNDSTFLDFPWEKSGGGALSGKPGLMRLAEPAAISSAPFSSSYGDCYVPLMPQLSRFASLVSGAFRMGVAEKSAIGKAVDRNA